jgi:hypothetical protein
MKWRKIAAAEVESTIGDPDMQQDSIKGRKNAFKALGGRLVKVTYCREGDDIDSLYVTNPVFSIYIS